MNDAAASTITAQNETEAAILSRRSIRGYLPTPIDQTTVQHILDVAARAPSGTNMQPWNVIALAGSPLKHFTDGLVDAFLGGAPLGNFEDLYYPVPLNEPYISRRRKVGWDLYGHLGIARGEKDKMRDQIVHNLRYFGASVGLICTIDKHLKIGSWLDYGMFVENIAVAARARNLDTCAMAIFAEFSGPVRRLLGIPETHAVVCGMALGHEDTSAPANRLVTTRVPAAEFADFRGF